MFEQERFIVRLRQRVLSEPAIIGCWLSGSYGRNAADAYSDIDVALLYRDDDARDGAWAQRKALCEGILAYVRARSMDAPFIGPHALATLYANGAKIDYRFLSRSSCTPTAGDAELMILKETADGWVADYQQRCRQAPTTIAGTSSAALRALDDQFWVIFWDVYRQVWRGDVQRPFVAYLDLLARTLPPLIALLPAEEPARRGLTALLYTQEAAATRRHLQQLLAAYRAARSAVIARYRLDYIPDGSFERELEKLLQRN